MDTRPRGCWAVALLVAGCAGFDPGVLAPGTPQVQAVAKLGPPTGEYPLDAGARRLEYAGGRFGRHTWMLDFDAGGSLRAVQQVLTERQFNALHPGQSRDEVLRAIGRPSSTWALPFQRQTVWAYRYVSPFCQWFQVGIGYDGTVVDTGYAPDPVCDDDPP